MDRKRQKLSPEKNDVQKECQDLKTAALEEKLIHMENKLKLTAEKNSALGLQSKNEKLQSENEKLQSENERLQKYLQDLEYADIEVEEKSKINLYNTDLSSQIIEIGENLNSGRSSSCTSESDLDENNLDDDMVEELNDDAFDINSLPEEIILRIFGHLNQNELGRIGRVCRAWNKLTRSPTLWKVVNVNFHESQSNLTRCFINTLPACVTCITINFKQNRRGWSEQLNFEEFCVVLQRRCPHLKILVFLGAILLNTLPSIIDLCTQYLQDVKTLVFRHSRFLACRLIANAGSCSKIEILEISDCDFIFDRSDADYFDFNNKPPFSRMPHLKQLHLFESDVDDSWFEDEASFLNQLHVLNLGCTHVTFRTFLTLQNHGHNLKKLYLCEVDLQKQEVHFSNSAFPHLETICIRDSLVRCESVISFIQSCQSLQNVYLNEGLAETFAAHPYVVANRYMSEIVKGIEWDHNHNYLHN